MQIVYRRRESHKELKKKMRYISIKIAARLRNKKHIVFTEDVNKIALIANKDKKHNQLIQLKHICTE